MDFVYQRIISPTHGDCFKCCLCTLLGLKYEDVPNFVEYKHWFMKAMNFCDKLGYDIMCDTYYNFNVHYLEEPTIGCYEEPKFAEWMSLDNLKKEDGNNGLFLASVYSPAYTTAEENPISHLHQVLCDADFNIVFDPNPNYKNIREYPYAKLIGYNGIRTIDAIRKKVE